MECFINCLKALLYSLALSLYWARPFARTEISHNWCLLAEYNQVINYVRHYSDKRGYSRHFTTKLLTAKWEERK